MSRYVKKPKPEPERYVGSFTVAERRRLHPRLAAGRRLLAGQSMHVWMGEEEYARQVAVERENLRIERQRLSHE